MPQVVNDQRLMLDVAVAAGYTFAWLPGMKKGKVAVYRPDGTPVCNQWGKPVVVSHDEAHAVLPRWLTVTDAALKLLKPSDAKHMTITFGETQWFVEFARGRRFAYGVSAELPRAIVTAWLDWRKGGGE